MFYTYQVLGQSSGLQLYDCAAKVKIFRPTVIYKMCYVNELSCPYCGEKTNIAALERKMHGFFW